MEHQILVGLSLILISGIGGQWLAWRLRVPSILMLLLLGVLFGPILGIFNPDQIFGNLLFPMVSLSVAVILFEGGLALRFDDLKGFGNVVRNLVTVGALVNLVVIALSAHVLFDLPLSLAILLGAVLIVTGPTVILPMLKFVRLNRQLSSILRWECVSIDTVGAILAVLVYEAIYVSSSNFAAGIVVFKIFITIFFGSLLGALGGYVLLMVFSRQLVPKYLQESLTLAIVILVYNLSNGIQAESGLLAVTVMGILLANQRRVELVHIITFKENLTIILLSTLFVMLAARLELEGLYQHFNIEMVLFLFVVIFLGRPLAVIISTAGSSLGFNDRLFLSWMGPRGIVAAAVSSFFAIKLSQAGVPGADKLVSITFSVIIVTVCLCGLTSRRLATWLGVVENQYRGVLLVGAHELARQMAHVLMSSGFSVLLVDTSKLRVMAARGEGLPVIHGSILSHRIQDEIESYGMGKLLALTQSDEVNLLAVMEYSSVLSQASVFRLCMDKKHEMGELANMRKRPGRVLFQDGVTFTYLMARITAGAKIQSIDLSEDEGYEAILAKNPKAVPLFLVTNRGRLLVFSGGQTISTVSAKTLIVLL